MRNHYRPWFGPVRHAKNAQQTARDMAEFEARTRPAWTTGMRPDEVQQRPCGCRGHNMPPGWLCPIHDLKLTSQWRAVLTDVV